MTQGVCYIIFLIFTISGTVSTKLSDIPIYKVKSELAT